MLQQPADPRRRAAQLPHARRRADRQRLRSHHGLQLQVAEGRSIAIKPTKSHGAPATINLEALLAAKPADRAKWLAEQTDQKLTGQAAEA